MIVIQSSMLKHPGVIRPAFTRKGLKYNTLNLYPIVMNSMPNACSDFQPSCNATPICPSAPALDPLAPSVLHP